MASARAPSFSFSTNSHCNLAPTATVASAPRPDAPKTSRASVEIPEKVLWYSPSRLRSPTSG